MKNTILFILVINVNFCLGQSVRFKLYTTKPCSTIEKIDSDYFLTPIPGRFDTAFYPKAGTVYLPHKGNYMLMFPGGPYLYTLIKIIDTGLFVFRLKEPKIGEYGAGIDQSPVYRSCDSLMNGYGEDFYPNGNIKIRGTFVKGRPKDSLVTFYQNGRLEERNIYLPKETYIEEYDSLSNLARVTHYKNGHRDKNGYYNEHSKTTEFFPAGEVKLTEFHFGHLVLIKEFYLNGQLKVKQSKRERIEYYNNGVKNITYTWWHTREKQIPKGHTYDFTIYKREYDKNGQILQLTVYEDWRLSNPQPNLDFSKSQYLVCLIKYDHGKEVSRAPYTDKRNYLKKHTD